MAARGVTFRSFFMAGFEGSTHRRRDGRRLDLVAATAHDRFARPDYRRMRRHGMAAARESLRWHLVEAVPGRYDFSMELDRMAAAAECGVDVVWDLCHFGWPDHVDVFAPEFADRFATYAEAAARARAEFPGPYWFTPMNEISFLAWAGGEVGAMNPFATARGDELKRQLVRAAILATASIRRVLPTARFLHPEPLINVAAHPERPHERVHAAVANEAQYQAWDMLAGRMAPELGGGPEYLDVVGVNYYPDNQWAVGDGPLPADSPERLPLHQMLLDVQSRYERPIVISETGTEDAARRRWLAHVLHEVRVAARAGAPVGAVCLYPILNHPGWEDDRHCRNGVWDYAGPRGGRRAHGPLVRLLRSTDAADRHRSVAASGRRARHSDGVAAPRRNAATHSAAGRRSEPCGPRT